MNVELVWITPEAEKLIAYMARVSNPSNQDNPSIEGLLKYMITHKHWSPFEMVSACFEVETTRDIGRQILRHRSFSFQEFSQRYASVDALPSSTLRECRLQDNANRQNSIHTDDSDLSEWWAQTQNDVAFMAHDRYQEALRRGIAKEQARALLPEGITTSRMYMAGSLRSWMHYCQLRCGPETQKEHREIAQAISDRLETVMPNVWGWVK